MNGKGTRVCRVSPDSLKMSFGGNFFFFFFSIVLYFFHFLTSCPCMCQCIYLHPHGSPSVLTHFFFESHTCSFNINDINFKPCSYLMMNRVNLCACKLPKQTVLLHCNISTTQHCQPEATGDKPRRIIQHQKSIPHQIYD